jgi:hypothetical protein
LEGTGVSKFHCCERGGAGCVIFWTTLAVMPAEFVFDAIEAELARRGIGPTRGCEVRRLTDNTVLLRLSRSDRIGNYDKLGGNAHSGLQWRTASTTPPDTSGFAIGE